MDATFCTIACMDAYKKFENIMDHLCAVIEIKKNSFSFVLCIILSILYIHVNYFY